MPLSNPISSLRLEVTGLTHDYDDRPAIRGIDLSVAKNGIVAVLGKNGSGKTTLFRLLGTLLPIQNGKILIDGIDSSSNPLAIRQRIGIIFQSPSLDIQLTVLENLRCQAALYGITGSSLRERIDEMLTKFDLNDRRNDFCKTLSGGLKRRVELAKGLLHRPRVMLLDEPSTGLDPSARLQLWSALEDLASEGVTILLTTHLMDEAEKANRVVFIHQGCKIVDDSPVKLRSRIGENVLTLVAEQPGEVQKRLEDELKISMQQVGDTLRTTCSDPSIIPRIMECLGDSLQTISLGRPSLEDVFIQCTGDSYHE